MGDEASLRCRKVLAELAALGLACILPPMWSKEESSTRFRTFDAANGLDPAVSRAARLQLTPPLLVMCLAACGDASESLADQIGKSAAGLRAIPSSSLTFS